MQLRHLALLALPTVINAVSLADMTPRATGLSDTCNAVYTSQIYGCAASDFQTQECSSTCISALYGLSQAIDHACANQGVTGENLVVAFLAGVGPQQVCHNAAPGGAQSMTAPWTSNHPHPTFDQPTIIPSTTTARKPTETSSLLVDTSSTMTQTIIPHPTHKSQPTTDSSSSPASSSTLAQTSAKTPVNHSSLAVDTSRTPTPAPTSKTTSSAGSSQTDLNDHSGGGSPFDTAGNVGSSAGGVSLSLASMILSAAAAIFVAAR